MADQQQPRESSSAGRDERPGGGRPRPYGPPGAGSRPTGGPGGFRRGGRPAPRRRVCRVCVDRTGFVDWKAVNFLRNFVTDRGKIMSARSRGTCASCQRQLTRAIKRARTMALLPFTSVY